jgi:rhodanese-related sulfurtransferase
MGRNAGAPARSGERELNVLLVAPVCRTATLRLRILCFVGGAAMPMPEFNQLCNEAKREIQEIDVEALKTMQKRGDSFELIDVREPDEVQRGTIPGAKHVSRGVLERDIDKVTTDKNRKIVLYCGGGSRSALSAWMLKKMGFNNVYSLIGGWSAWNK